MARKNLLKEAGLTKKDLAGFVKQSKKGSLKELGVTFSKKKK
jgi:hypothetical protein